MSDFTRQSAAILRSLSLHFSAKVFETLLAALVVFAVPLILLLQCAKKTKSKSPEALPANNAQKAKSKVPPKSGEIETADERPDSNPSAVQTSDPGTLTPSQQAKLQAEIDAAVRAKNTRQSKVKNSDTAATPKNDAPEDNIVQSAYVHSKPANCPESAYVPKKPIKAGK